MNGERRCFAREISPPTSQQLMPVFLQPPPNRDREVQ